MEFWEKFLDTSDKITADTIICFDSEVSSYWIDNGKIIEYDYNLTDEYYNSIEKGSCLYIWQTSVNDTIYYGRELEDFRKFCDELERRFEKKKDKDVITIWIHNLSYDFQFLRNLYNYEFVDVFARTMRKPMKARVNNIVFRCSYVAVNMSLKTWGKQLGINKLSGDDFNYKKIRTPKTKLTKEELSYCKRDIEVMIAGIKKLLEEYKHIKDIPLTNTGQVRKPIKKIFSKDVRYKKNITKCLPHDVEHYLIDKQVFSGGDTHTNIINANKTLYNIASFDETSAYIYYMFVEKFPCSPFLEVLPSTKLDFEKYSYIMLIRLDNLNLKKGCTLSYISTSRTVNVVNGTYDNGRIMKADSVAMYVTELDYQDILSLYDCDVTILTLRRARKAYLDTRFIMYMLDLFYKKTSLKGLKEWFDLYMSSKNRLNALFGCMVMDVIQSIIGFNGEWFGEGQLTQDIQSALDKMQEKWWANYFSYEVGLYITSYARAGLWQALKMLPNNDVCYFDTDSTKFKDSKANRKIFEKLNEERYKKCVEACKHHDLDIESFQPKAPNGKKSILGAWDFETVYSKARFLGAKKYCVEVDGELEITVSGVPKSAVKDLSSIEDFKNGFHFSAKSCKKGLSTYLDGNNPKVNIDGYIVDQPFGINIRDIGYTLGLTSDFDNMIHFMWEHGEI